MPWITVIILFIVSIYILRKAGNALAETLIYGILVALFIVALITMMFNFNNNKEIITFEETYTNTYDVIALNDNFGLSGEMSGSFFLGIGSVHGEINVKPTYFFYTETNNKLKLHKEDPNDINIILTNDTISKYHVKIKHTIREIDGYWKHLVFHNKRTEHWTTIDKTIIVPRGAVKQNLNLDLK